MYCLYGHLEPDDEMWAAMRDIRTTVASAPEDELGMEHRNPIAFEAVKRGVKCSLGALSPLSLSISRSHL